MFGSGSSPFTTIESVDQPGVTVAVVTGSAYDLYLTRALKNAILFRYRNKKAAADAFLSGAVPVLGSVKQPLAALVADNPGHRMLPGRFMSIEQTMGTPRDRDPAALAMLQAFIADAKASGLVARALAESKTDAVVAP